MWLRPILLSLAAVLVVPLLAPAPAGARTALSPRTGPDRERIVVSGDSISVEFAPYLRTRVGGAFAVETHQFGGTAPCDWTDELARVAADPSVAVVVLSFIGNAITPCMRGSATDVPSPDRIVDRYRADVRSIVRLLRDAGLPVVLTGQPARADRDGDEVVERLNALYGELAALDPAGVLFLDAGALVEREGRYASTLPCADTDPVCDPDGTVRVRADGLHLCPVVSPTAGCPVYSPGARRMGTALADAAMLLAGARPPVTPAAAPPGRRALRPGAGGPRVL